MKKHRPKPRPRRKPFARGGRAWKREARRERYLADARVVLKAMMDRKRREADLAHLDDDNDPLGLEGY